ncbi:unnamed protein product [Closterium sp. NIES-54]
MTTLRVLLHVAAQRDYELHSLDFSTAFLQGSLHEEIWLRRPPGFTGSFPPVARHTEDYTCGSWVCSFYCRPVAVSTHRHLFAAVLHPRVLQSFDFTYSSPQATPLSTRHSLSTLPSDESVEPSGPYPELVGCLIQQGHAVSGAQTRAHRTKHIALRYFLARELQQRGQLRLAYVASEANTADIFTKALAPGDDQRFCTMLGFPTFAAGESLATSRGAPLALALPPPLLTTSPPPPPPPSPAP